MLGLNPRICAELGEIVAGIGYMGPGTYQIELIHVFNHVIVLNSCSQLIYNLSFRC